MRGPVGQFSLLALAAVLIAGCAAPRATWVRPGQGAATSRPARPEPTPAPEARPSGRVHVVEKGETLYRIATRHGLSVDELARANEIDDPSRLEVGQRLQIPPGGRQGGGRVAARTGSRTTVSRGEPGSRLGGEAPLRWPLQGVLYSRFGPRGATRHDGIDISAPAGTPIEAAADGTVIYAGVQRGYGNIVILRHQGDLVTIYAHNQRNLVEEGQQVKAGEPVALVGATGRATGPHCHFEVRRGTTPHDPLDFLP